MKVSFGIFGLVLLVAYTSSLKASIDDFGDVFDNTELIEGKMEKIEEFCRMNIQYQECPKQSLPKVNERCADDHEELLTSAIKEGNQIYSFIIRLLKLQKLKSAVALRSVDEIVKNIKDECPKVPAKNVCVLEVLAGVSATIKDLNSKMEKCAKDVKKPFQDNSGHLLGALHQIVCDGQRLLKRSIASKNYKNALFQRACNAKFSLEYSKYEENVICAKKTMFTSEKETEVILNKFLRCITPAVQCAIGELKESYSSIKKCKLLDEKKNLV